MALACVARDYRGNIVFVASKLCNCNSVYEAEVAAADWASAIAEKKKWNFILWSSDAEVVVKAINDEAEPVIWSPRYEILRIRERLQKFKWKFCGNQRSSNALSDSIAKESLFGLFNFYFDDSNLELLPSVFLIFWLYWISWEALVCNPLFGGFWL